MNIKNHRLVARNAWKLASSFIELSPTAQKVLGIMSALSGSVESKPPKGQFVRRLILRILKWRLDKLILIDDASVRVMTLKAMAILKHRSRHLGFIATLHASEEMGYTVNEKGENMSSEYVHMEVWRYFLDLLDVSTFFTEIERSENHWESVLSYDYTKEYSVEDRWDFSGDKPVHIHRKVPAEEVTERLRKNKEEVMELYEYDLKKLLEKKLSGYYEQREEAVRKCLEDIFGYIFSGKVSEKTIGEVLELLARVARTGHFPEKWLVEFSKKYVA